MMTSTALPYVTESDLLSRRQCDVIRGAVHALRPAWRERYGFFTLGTAAYLDAAEQSFAIYQERATAQRELLLVHFGALYETVRRRLEELMASPVVFAEWLSLPGFHIWLAPRIPSTPQRSQHFDLQYLSVEWPIDPAPDFERLISFTLPIRLPAAGGGLDIWDLGRNEVGDRDINALMVNRRMIYCPYAEGRLVIHSGLLLHRIAATPRVTPRDERITLQGHGVRSADRWYLYW